MKNPVNADYSAAPAGRLLDKLLSSQRRKLVEAFTVFRQGDGSDTILNVGMMPTPLFDSTNYLAEWSSPQDRPRITSYEIAPSNYHLRTGAREQHRQADGLGLPFADGEFDWVFCNEVIERVGSFGRQYGLLKELARVARKGVFVATSNRRHPIEFNTELPFIHWLPAPCWRRVLKWSGKSAWASESVLNLLDAKGLYKLASLLPGKPKHDVGHKRVFGVKAHFFLMIEKNIIADEMWKASIEETRQS